LVCKLKKALYGLKQAPRAWFERCSRAVEGAGFQRSQSDHSMFIRRSTSGIVLFLVYVDDIAFSSNDLASINELKRTLRTQFDMKDLGDSKSVLPRSLTQQAL